MRILNITIRLILAVLLQSTAALAFEIEQNKFYPVDLQQSVLRIISTADLDAFHSIILAFQKANPGVAVDYTITGTTDLMKALEEEGAVFDLAISSAMDLQTKLVNDGFALSYTSPATSALPDWAVWRDQLFAFTQEPAVLVVSDAFFTPDTAPKNRAELITVLRDNPDRFKGRIGTYDVRSSGFGYLIATQDSRNSEAFWRLMEVMGRLDAQLYCCSSDMIHDVASGKLALAYNVLGSYAASQLTTTEGFQIIELSDFANVMLRTALIPTNAENTKNSHAMVDFLAALNRRPDLVRSSGLPAIDAAALQANPSLRPIRLGPGLMVFLDRLKRQNFLRSWENSIVQE